LRKPIANRIDFAIRFCNAKTCNNTSPQGDCTNDRLRNSLSSEARHCLSCVMYSKRAGMLNRVLRSTAP